MGKDVLDYGSFSLGVAMGGALVGVLALIFFPPSVDEIRLFRQEEKQFIRLYKNLARDRYYIQDPKNSDRYIPLGKYKESLVNEYERISDKNYSAGHK